MTRDGRSAVLVLLAGLVGLLALAAAASYTYAESATACYGLLLESPGPEDPFCRSYDEGRRSLVRFLAGVAALLGAGAVVSRRRPVRPSPSEGPGLVGAGVLGAVAPLVGLLALSAAGALLGPSGTQESFGLTEGWVPLAPVAGMLGAVAVALGTGLPARAGAAALAVAVPLAAVVQQLGARTVDGYVPNGRAAAPQLLVAAGLPCALVLVAAVLVVRRDRRLPRLLLSVPLALLGASLSVVLHLPQLLGRTGDPRPELPGTTIAVTLLGAAGLALLPLLVLAARPSRQPAD